MKRAYFLVFALIIHTFVLNIIATSWGNIQVRKVNANSPNGGENKIAAVQLISESANSVPSLAVSPTRPLAIPSSAPRKTSTGAFADPSLFSPDSAIVGDAAIQAMPRPAPETSKYFTADELSKIPAMIIDPSLRSKILTQAARKVSLNFLINEEGRIDSIEIDTLLDDMDEAKRIKEIASEIEFIPGKINGVPVKSQMHVEMEM